MPEPMTDERFAEIQQRAEREPNADVLALIAEVKWLRFDREQIDTERAAAVDAYNEASRRAEKLEAATLRVRELHEHLIEDGDDGDGYHKIHLCGDCGTSWPCATIAVLDRPEGT